jgi:hypothetical protein
MAVRPKIEENELLLIRTAKGARWTRKLRVVEKTVDGGIKAPKIESRLYFANDSPYGRLVGLDLDDGQAIVDNWPAIKACWTRS